MMIIVVVVIIQLRALGLLLADDAPTMGPLTKSGVL